MMELSRISLVCWHLFERADLDVSGDTAILGRNRSGKSTLIDLIQTVMTGASGQLYRFNRSAGDGGSRSERSLRGYCLGQLNEHAALRQQGITHIALSFEDPTRKQLPVTVGLCLEAPPGHDGVTVEGRYVAEGVKIDTTYFVNQVEPGQTRVAPWSVLRDRLERSCKAANRSLLTTETSRNHIREYMRLLFSGRRSPDPERFARAFVLALSFEDIRSVESFVRNYLLEKKDIDIGELRDSIQRYRQIQKDIHELIQKLEVLKNIRALIATYEDLLRREGVARGTERLALLVEAGAALFSYVKDMRDKGDVLRSGRVLLKQCEDDLARAEERLKSLAAQLADPDADHQRRGLESETRDVERERDGLANRLRARFATTARATEMLPLRERLQILRLGDLLNVLDLIQAQSAGLVPPEWPRDADAMDELTARAGDLADKRLPFVTERRNEAISLRHQCQTAMEALRTGIEQARRGNVELQPNTVALLDTLRREGMRPRVLCQVLDVVEDDWRDAAEALLGQDREAILVDAQHASRAVELLRADRIKFRGCRVANTRRLEAESRSAPAGSLAAVLRSDDVLAMAFVVFRLGNVHLAANQEELLRGGRAVMRDGAYNDGLVVEVRRPAIWKIGRAAAGLTLDALERELGDLEAVRKRHDENVVLFDDTLRRLEQLSTPIPDADRLVNLVSSFAERNERLAAIRTRLAKVTDRIDPAVRREHDETQNRVEKLTSEKLDLRVEHAKLETEIAGIRRDLGAGESHLGSRLSLAFRRRMFRESVGNLALFTPVRAEYVQRRGKRQPARVAQDMYQEAQDLQSQYRACEADIRESVSDYRRQFNAIAPSGADRLIVVHFKPWVEEDIAALEDNQLVQYRRQADDAAEQIGRLLRTGFIHELNARFSMLETDLDELAKALRARPLHNEIYRLRAFVKPEFEALHRLARESETDETVLEALFGRGTPRDERHAAALAQVERLLEDEGGQFEDFQDYRNYYGFDLTMRDIESGRETSFERRRGVASGAERQVPFYVIIGAALANLYHGTKRPGQSEELGIGLATFDEAFSKLDGPNQRTLLDFYGDIGLQVLIAAPTEKRAVVYENLDSIIDVHRYGDKVSAETTIIKERARAAMREANPEYMSDDTLREKLSSAAAEVVVK